MLKKYGVVLIQRNTCNFLSDENSTVKLFPETVHRSYSVAWTLQRFNMLVQIPEFTGLRKVVQAAFYY
jgi:hypothetical protein